MIEQKQSAGHASASETGQASAWQPISSAPKDGTRIVLYTSEGTTYLGDWSILPFRNQETAYWRDDSLEMIKPAPTHWMLLPLAPSEDETTTK